MYEKRLLYTYKALTLVSEVFCVYSFDTGENGQIGRGMEGERMNEREREREQMQVNDRERGSYKWNEREGKKLPSTLGSVVISQFTVAVWAWAVKGHCRTNCEILRDKILDTCSWKLCNIIHLCTNGTFYDTQVEVFISRGQTKGIHEAHLGLWQWLF